MVSANKETGHKATSLKTIDNKATSLKTIHKANNHKAISRSVQTMANASKATAHKVSVATHATTMVSVDKAIASKEIVHKGNASKGNAHKEKQDRKETKGLQSKETNLPLKTKVVSHKVPTKSYLVTHAKKN